MVKIWRFRQFDEWNVVVRGKDSILINWGFDFVMGK